MRAHTEYLSIETKERYEIRDITDDVARIVATAALREGMVLVSAMHITASVSSTITNRGFGRTS